MPVQKDWKKSNSIQTFNQLPVNYESRQCTDVCCIITGVAFALSMLITAIVLFNKNNFYEVNFPADSDGKLCGYDYQNHQYLFFSNAPSISNRVCVSKCPSKGDSSLSCMTNSEVPSCNFSPKNKYYDSVSQRTRMGFFCYPSDQAMQQKLKDVGNLNNQQNFYQSLDSIKSCLIFALITSLAYFFLVQFLPSIANFSIVILAIIALAVASYCTFAFQTQKRQLAIALGVILIFIIVLILISLYKGRITLKMHVIFLNYACNMVKQKFFVFIYVLLYLIFFALFVTLILFEFAGFWTGGKPTLHADRSIYFQLQGPTISPLFTTILLVQFIWGASFLKQSFNFCISGNSVSWFFGQERQNNYSNGIFYPLKLQITKHLGSVVACSFFTAFLSLMDLLFDLFKPIQSSGSYYNFCHCCCRPCFSLWDLVRSDAMSFVNLTGNPFCNSARYCEYLCEKTLITEYSQSCSRIYRICSHFFISSLVLIFSVIFTSNKSIYAYFIILFGSLSISTFFISIHADAAEAIQIAYLLDQQFTHRNQNELVHNQQGLSKNTVHREIGEQISKVYEQFKFKQTDNSH